MTIPDLNKTRLKTVVYEHVKVKDDKGNELRLPRTKPNPKDVSTLEKAKREK